MSAAKDYKYDLAISFLSRDESLALELYARLSESMSVFVYSKKQEELAGTDGLESFRSVFRHDSRLVVVLYREGWGDSPWTRVEQGAITDRFLPEGWAWLFFAMLDRKERPPKWLPETHVHFNLEDYGIEQAIGAIKARIQQLGGRLKKLDVLEQAQLLGRKATFLAEKRRLMSSVEGVNAVREQVELIYGEIGRRVSEIKEATKLAAEIGRDRDSCVITNRTISVNVWWRLRAVNSLENSPLLIDEFRGRLPLPGEQIHYLKQPRKLSTTEYDPEVCLSRPNEYLSSLDVADQCVATFLRLVDQVISGKIKPLSILDDD
jgi:hypothetical protein